MDYVIMKLDKIYGLFIQMPHADGVETSSRNDFIHRPRPIVPDKRVLYNNAGREGLSKYNNNNYYYYYNNIIIIIIIIIIIYICLFILLFSYVYLLK